jgi:tetratricopeptide (TPR) repeat protein
LGWVFEHTVPVLHAEASFVQDLIRIDVDALESLVDGIAHCMARRSKAADIVAFVTHLESAVPLEAFRPRATYLKAVWLYIALDDRAAAKTHLSSLGDILKTDHRETLELYLDVFGGALSPRQRLAVADEILAKADKELEILIQYSTVKAVALVMVGEQADADSLLRAVVTDAIEQRAINAGTDTRLAFLVAHALEFRAKTSGDVALYERAERVLQSIRPEYLTGAGQAHLHFELGRVQFDRGHYQPAIDAFSRSRALEPSAVADIHLAHALALAGSSPAARQVLASAERQPIEPVLQLELLAAWAAVAVTDADIELATQTVKRLRAVAEDSPFWAGQRDRLVIELMDFIARPKALPVSERHNRLIAVLLWLNQVLELKPNVFGLGIDINKLLDKLAGTSQNHQSMSQRAVQEPIDDGHH